MRARSHCDRRFQRTDLVHNGGYVRLCALSPELEVKLASHSCSIKHRFVLWVFNKHIYDRPGVYNRDYLSPPPLADRYTWK